MTKRHWITTKECKKLYNISASQLINLVKHNVVTVKKEKTTGRGRAKNLYNHLQVKIYGKLTRGERRNYMSKLNGTKLGRKTNLPANYAKSFVRSHDEAKSYREIEDWGLDFSAGNVVKYIVRAGKKNSSQKKKDLQKALWYLIRMLKDE